MDTWVWVVIALVLIGVVVFFLKSKKEDGASEQVKDFAASEKTENVEDSSVSENSSQEKRNSLRGKMKILLLIKKKTTSKCVS